jgi:hypothetical protein
MDKGNCTAGGSEAHGYQGLPKGSVRTVLLRKPGVDAGEKNEEVVVMPWRQDP